MKTREELIEEMAKDLEEAKYYAIGTVGSLNNGFGGWYGEYMYKKGYRKQSDTVREFVERLKQIRLNRIRIGEYDGIDLWLDVKKLAKEYGVEVEE